MRVFVSHSEMDLWLARQIAHHIRDCGAATFLDRDDIDHGDNFWLRIREVAPNCAEIAVLLTPWSVRRPYLWMEVGLFSGADKRVVAIYYGMTLQKLKSDPNVAGAIDMLDMVELSQIDSYFDQLRGRVRGEIADAD